MSLGGLGPNRSATSSPKYLLALFSIMLLVASLVTTAVRSEAALAGACNCVIFRLDDIQDWWLNTVQPAVMDQFIAKNANLSIGAVMNYIGSDPTVVNKVRQGHSTGLFELVSHGWNHVDYAQLDFQTQKTTLQNSSDKMQTLWGRGTKIFIPPYNSYDNDTLQATKDIGMKIISSEFDLEIVPTSQIYKAVSGSDITDSYGIYHLPQEVGFYNYDFDPPHKNKLSTIESAINSAINTYGYAVVTLHPQDFSVKDANNQPTNQVNQSEITDLNTLIDWVRITQSYRIKTYSAVTGVPLPPIVDNVPPVIIPPADVAVVSSQTLTTVSLGTPTVTDNVDPSPIVTNNAPSTGFSQGTTKVIWTATDHSGNSATAIQYVTVATSADTVRPTVSISSPASGSIIGPASGLNLPVTGTASDAQSGVKIVEVRTDTLAYGTATPSSLNNWSNWSKVLRFTSSGSTTIVARATDFWGNQQWFSTPVTITLSGPDTTPPAVTPPPDITIEATAQLTPVLIGRATAFDNSDPAPVITNNAPGASESTGFPLGTTIVTWTATDAAGNVGTATQTVTVVDTTAPTVPSPLTPLGGSITTSNQPTFSWSNSTDLVSPVTYDLIVSQDSTFASAILISQTGLTTESYKPTFNLADGHYYWKVRSSDSSENKSPYSTVSDFIVDSNSPSVTASPAGGLYNTTQSVTLTASKSGSTIYYTTDGSSPSQSSPIYSSPISIASTSDLKFFAVDSLGNLGPTYTESYTIDTIAPTVAASPSGGTYGASQQVTLTASEPATIYYTTDGSLPTKSSTVYFGPIAISKTTTLRFFAVDTAGNAGSVVTETYTITTITSTSLTVNPISSVPWGQSVSISGRLTTTNGLGIGGALISFNGNGTSGLTNTITAADGAFITTGPSPSAVGLLTVQAHYAGNSTYGASDSAIQTYRTTVHATTISLGISPSSVSKSGTFSATAILKDATTNTPLSAKTISFTAKSPLKISSGTTDSTGTLIKSGLSAPNKAGTYDIIANFGGDSLYSASQSNKVTLTVK